MSDIETLNKLSENKVQKKDRVCFNIEECLDKIDLKDGMTIAFHQHFKDGDYVLNNVLESISKKSIFNLTLLVGVIENIHAPIIEHIKSGVISKIITNGLKGPVADIVSRGLMKNPVEIISYGEKARRIKEGDIKINASFIGIPVSDSAGNGGFKDDFCCGSFGFIKELVQYAQNVILVSEDLVDFPNLPAKVEGEYVDYVIKLPSIGDPKGMLPKMVKYTKNPREILMGNYAFEFIKNSGYLKDKFSFKCSVFLPLTETLKKMKEYMIENKISSSYYFGEVFNPIIEMKEEGILNKIVDIQSSDLTSVESIQNDRDHVEGTSFYYCEKENSLINMLDINISTALEVDTNYNVNLITSFDGTIKGQIDSYKEVSSYAKLNILVFPLIKGRISSICKKVKTICATSSNVDVIVTDRGIAINPLRMDLIAKFKNSNLPICTIEELYEKSVRLIGIPSQISFGEKVVATINNMDNDVIDNIREII